MNKLFFICIATLILACNSKEKNKESTKNTNADNTIFYPYTYYIQTEADSLLKTKKTFLGNFTDSSGNKKPQVINTDYFKNIVNQFTSKDITDSAIKRYFQETVFRDLTTNSIVMTYSTKSDNSTIKNVDIYLDGNNNNLKRIDLKVLYMKADSSFTENYTWIIGKELHLVKYAEANGKGKLSRTNIQWNLKN